MHIDDNKLPSDAVDISSFSIHFGAENIKMNDDKLFALKIFHFRALKVRTWLCRSESLEIYILLYYHK